LVRICLHQGNQETAAVAAPVFCSGSDKEYHNEKAASIAIANSAEYPRLIDEWQMAPALWDAVRFAVDQRGECGQFILTGSAVPTDNATWHTGTGRISRLLMRPMTLFESGESSGDVSLRAFSAARAKSWAFRRLRWKSWPWRWSGAVGPLPSVKRQDSILHKSLQRHIYSPSVRSCFDRFSLRTAAHKLCISLAMMISATRDTLFPGALSCRQPERGYRFSLDAVLLAHFARPGQGARVVDLAAGCGVIGLIALYRYPQLASCLAVEVQEELAFFARGNFRDNGFAEKSAVICGDIARIKELLPAQSADLVFCNPPYYQPGHGRQSRIDSENMARHQKTPVTVFAHAAAWCLGEGGQAAFIYPAGQLAELFAACGENRLAVKRLRFLYSYPGLAATRALVLCRKGGGPGLVALAPLFVYAEKNGPYSQEVAEMYAADGSESCWRN
jgi:tRNA1(Val) A37 N6-methylase TrmN6